MRHPGWGSRAFLDTLCHGKKGEMLRLPHSAGITTPATKVGALLVVRGSFSSWGVGESSDSRIDGGIARGIFQIIVLQKPHEPPCST